MKEYRVCSVFNSMEGIRKEAEKFLRTVSKEGWAPVAMSAITHDNFITSIMYTLEREIPNPNPYR